jgi:hypothetical protein
MNRAERRAWVRFMESTERRAQIAHERRSRATLRGWRMRRDREAMARAMLQAPRD